MRLEHHLVGGYVRYISPHIIIIIITICSVHINVYVLTACSNEFLFNAYINLGWPNSVITTVPLEKRPRVCVHNTCRCQAAVRYFYLY